MPGKLEANTKIGAEIERVAAWLIRTGSAGEDDALLKAVSIVYGPDHEIGCDLPEPKKEAAPTRPASGAAPTEGLKIKVHVHREADRSCQIQWISPVALTVEQRKEAILKELRGLQARAWALKQQYRSLS